MIAKVVLMQRNSNFIEHSMREKLCRDVANAIVSVVHDNGLDVPPFDQLDRVVVELAACMSHGGHNVIFDFPEPK